MLKKAKKKSASPAVRRGLASKLSLLQEEVAGFARTLKANGIEPDLVEDAVDSLERFAETLEG